MNLQWSNWCVEVTRDDMDGKCGVSLSLWNNESSEATALTNGYLSLRLKGSRGAGYLVGGHSSWYLLLLCHGASTKHSTGRALFLLVLQFILDPLESKG